MNISQREYKRAIKARDLYVMVGYPSTQDFINMVKFNLLENCNISERDIINAEQIFGKDIYAIKGKTVRKVPAPVEINYIEVPEDIFDKYKDVTISADIMYVQGIMFFVSVSKHIKFTTEEIIDNRSAKTLFKCLQNIQKVYKMRDFNIKCAMMDPEFQTLDTELRGIGILLNTTSAKEHVPEIERQIRVIKERVRCAWQKLPYEYKPNVMVRCLVQMVVTWLNNFPPKGGVSKTLSPRMIITGTKLNMVHHCRLEFGSYAQVHEEPDKTNRVQDSRSTGAICLGPADNQQGGVKFMSLNTGKLITRRSFTPIPLTADVIRRVNELGMADKNNNTLEIKHRESPDNDDESIASNNTHDNDNRSDDDDVTTISNPINMEDNNNNENDDAHSHNGASITGVDHGTNSTYDNIDDVTYDNEEDNPLNDEPTIQLPEDVVPPPEPETEKTPYVTRSGRISKPVQRLNPVMSGKTYDTINLNASLPLTDGQFAAVVVKTMVHYSMLEYQINKDYPYRTAKRLFGDKARSASYTEMEQLHLRGTFLPKHYEDIEPERRKEIIESHTLVKIKNDLSTKARTVADGSKQRGTVPDEDKASPTVNLESIFLTSAIDAKEHRSVATLDIPNAFIQSDMEKDDVVIMAIRGEMVELLLEIAYDIYAPYVHEYNGKKVLYVQLLKALYGLLKAAMLFYIKFSTDMISQGFKLNPYDPCVANKIINNKQMTVCWHVDDLKVSHVEDSEIDKFIVHIKNNYEDEKIGTVKTSRGAVHKYLGMQLDFSVDGKVSISMKEYIENIIKEFPENITGTSSTPAAEHLFKIREQDAKPLSEEKAGVFHTTVAQCLFLCKRARPDIQLAVGFLTTRVQKPDEDDWKKLLKMLKYLNGTKNLNLTLEADDSKNIYWWVDVAYAVHMNCRSHTGGTMSLGKGSPISMSTKQKINVKSSTEAELVGTDDAMGNIIWTNYFLKEQGYDVNRTIVYQDNKSAILLEKNGRASSGKRTKHINVRYFFIKDRIDKKELEVEYCKTEDMLADFFTKALQGKQFFKLRKLIMNEPDYSKPNTRSLVANE